MQALQQALRSSGDRARLPAIYLGTPGPRRKAVCYVSGPSGIDRVVKVPIACSAREAILHEADVLSRLERTAGAPRAPRLIEIDQRRGLAAQTWLPGRPGRRDFGEQHASYLSSLRGVDVVNLNDAVDTALADATQPTEGSSAAAVAATLLEDCRADLELPAYLVHGDFAAWNIKHSSDGLAALDWEDAQMSGLPLQDLAHFYANDFFLFGAAQNPFMALLSSATARAVIDADDLDEDAVRRLLLYYCGAMAIRRLARGETAFADYLLAQSSVLAGR
jgi:hypothetical protein